MFQQTRIRAFVIAFMCALNGKYNKVRGAPFKYMPVGPSTRLAIVIYLINSLILVSINLYFDDENSG